MVLQWLRRLCPGSFRLQARSKERYWFLDLGTLWGGGANNFDASPVSATVIEVYVYTLRII